MMIGAGAGTHIVGYENEVTKLRTLENIIEEINMHKKAGAEIMMIESEGITEDLPPEKWRIDVIKNLMKNLDLKALCLKHPILLSLNGILRILAQILIYL